MKLARVCRVLSGIYLLAIVLAGSMATAAEPIALRAGRLSMVFDADNAFLRYVKVGRDEILRGVNAPIRDQVWGTVRPKISNLQLDNHDDHFKLTFDATCQDRDIDLRWRGTLVGTQAGEVEFAFDGVAHSTFKRNRIGFCVLHSSTAAGKPWIIKHADGVESKGYFPTFISPHQPAKAIRAVSHEVADKLWAHVELTGDVFEMEDQRNWTDASFKTYCTPLELPYPVQVDKGTKISQKVRIRVTGDIPKDSPNDQRVTLTLGKRVSDLPRIGLQVSSEATELSQRQLQRLKELRLDHLHADLQPADPSFADKLRQANAQAKALGVPLHLGVQVGELTAAELANLVRELKAASPNVAAYVVSVTDWRELTLARDALKEVVGKPMIVAATGANFVDINRDRPTGDDFDAVSFGMTPQIHAFDEASMVETLPIQSDAVRSARQFIGQRPLLIGPITLRQALPGQKSAPGALPPDVDVRQPASFAAAWTLGSIKYLSDEGVHSATYYETVGWKGVMDLDQRAARPASFPSMPGDVFAAYHLFREIGEFAGGRTQQLDSSAPLSVVGLAMKKAARTRVLIANMTARPQSVTLRGLDAPAKVSLVVAENPKVNVAQPETNDTKAADRANRELSITLPPRSVVRIDRAID